MALIFRGSKISRKAVFDIFVEIISRKSRHTQALGAARLYGRSISTAVGAIRQTCQLPRLQQ